MTQQLEDALRTAFRAKAAQIPSVPPPLRLDALPDHGRPDPRRTPWGSPGRRRLLAGLGAAAAVTAVAIGTVVASSSAPHRPGQGTRPAGTLPAYYVALTNHGPRASFHTIAVVRSSRTGAVLASLQAPAPYRDFVGVSGAADDRTFVLEASNWQRNSLNPHVRFYLLRITPGATQPAGRASLRGLDLRLPSPYNAIRAMALSPDGHSLAVVAYPVAAVHDPGTPDPTRIIVYDLATGSSRTWTDQDCRDNCSPAGNLAGNFTMDTIGWTADGGHLGFALLTGASGQVQFRLLNVRADGGSVLAGSQPVPLRAAPGVLGGVNPRAAIWGASLLTPAGNAVIIDASNAQSNAQPWPPQTLLQYSARTGALQAVLGQRPTTPGNAAIEVLWSSPDGSTLLVTGLHGKDSAGVLHRGRYTAIPWSGQLLSAAW